MAAQCGQYADPRQVYDADQDLAADVVQLTGVNRLRVEALLSGSGGGTVASRDADADDDFNFSLVGFLTNSRLGVWSLSGGNWARWFADVPNSAAGRSVLGLTSAFVHAIATGRDTSPGAGSEVLRLTETRALSGFNAGATSLIGHLVAAHTMGLDVSAGTLSQIHSEQASAIGGQTAANVNALFVAALLAGVDTTGAATTRAVEVRDAGADGDYASALIGLTANVRLSAFGSSTGDYVRLLARTVNGAIDETAERFLAVRAAITGIDNGAVAGSRNVPVEARAQSGWDSSADSLITLGTSSTLLAVAGATGTIRRLFGDTPAVISGTVATAVRGLYVNSVVAGLDNTGAAVLRAVEARNFDVAGDVASTLIGLLVNSRTAALRTTTGEWAGVNCDTPGSRTGDSDTSFVSIDANAYLFGTDTTGAAVVRAIEARNFDAAADIDAALVGLLVNSRTGIFDATNLVFRRLDADLLVNVPGSSNASKAGAYVHAMLTGVDTTGATVLRQVEARGGGLNANFASALIGATVNNRNALYVHSTYGGSGDWLIEEGFPDVSTGIAGAISADLRKVGYLRARAGRQFRVTDAGAGVAITNGFTATAPTFLLQAGATNDLIISKFRIWLATAGTAPIRVRAILDPDSRYSSGGTSRTPANTNGASVTTSTAAQVRDGAITATAADADEREVFSGMLVNSAGEEIDLTEEDCIIIPANGTLLIYVYGGAAAGTFDYTMEFEEANVQ